jgi:hypothetical protein
MNTAPWTEPSLFATRNAATAEALPKNIDVDAFEPVVVTADVNVPLPSLVLASVPCALPSVPVSSS